MKKFWEIIRKINAWFFKSEKHLTEVLRHIFICTFFISYIDVIYIEKHQESTLAYNMLIIFYIIIFIILAKYLAKMLFKWKAFTEKIDKNKKDSI